MIRKPVALVVALTVVATFGAGAVSAQSVRFYSLGSGTPTPGGPAPPGTLPPNFVTVTNFGSDTPGSAPASTAPGYSWAGGGTGLVFDPALSGSNGAEPAELGGPDTGNYLSVEGGASETLDIAPGIRYLTMYIGSIDAYNTLSFDVTGDPNPVVLTGANFATYSGGDDGNQSAGDTNGLFTFLFNAPVTSVTFSSTQNSFEIASIGAAPTPEPASWALLIFGVGLAGGMLRLVRKSDGAAFAPVA